MTEEKKDALGRPSSEKVQVPDVANVRALAKDLLDSGLFPGVKSVAGAVAILQAGLELGIPPVAALNTMVIINGRLAMEAKLLLAVAHQRAGVTWEVTKEGPEGCWLTFHRPGWPDVESSFTVAEAKAANLLGKTNWQLWGKDMYFARAAGRGVRRIAPDATLGFYAREELADAEGVDLSKTEKEDIFKTALDKLDEVRQAISDATSAEKYPGVVSAEVHAPKPVADEFSGKGDLTDPKVNPFSGQMPDGWSAKDQERYEASLQRPQTEVEKALEAGLDAPAEESGADPLAEAHHDTPEKHAEKMAEQPGRGPTASTIAQYEKFAKVKADLATFGVDEQALWNGIHRFTQSTYQLTVTELSQFTEPQLENVIAYAHRWKKAVEKERASKEAKNKGEDARGK